jgi:L,D-transpeptidase catalytic domain
VNGTTVRCVRAVTPGRPSPNRGPAAGPRRRFFTRACYPERVALEPVRRKRRKRRGLRRALWVIGLALVAGACAAGAALLWWPEPSVQTDTRAFARIVEPGYAGRVSSVVVRRPDGHAIPVDVRHGRLWPRKQLRVGEKLTVEVTVHRPGWAGWLVGHTASTTLVMHAPEAQLRGRWLEIDSGAPVVARFDTPVRTIVVRSHGDVQTLHFAKPRRKVDVGVIATGKQAAGSVWLSAVPRVWEQLPEPVRLSWFPAKPTAQALVEPATGVDLAPDRPITLTFSRPVHAIFGTSLPKLTPSTPGRWHLLDAHTLSFEPRGLGYPLSGHVAVHLPKPVGLPQATRVGDTRTLAWDVRHGTILRLEQLLAQAGYLPLEWTPAEDPMTTTAQSELAATVDPPAGRFHWRYENTPHELQALWKTGEWNQIVRGAVMMFEHDHQLDVDGFVGPKVWGALLADTLAGQKKTDGYSYVYVHRAVPQSLTLWHNGRIVLSSPGNTGVPAAPTQLGTFPVFEHIPIGTMSGTNPDGTHYHDPGIRWISYFNHGDAIHAFTRASFGTPQSLGCVELPLAAAATVWPYTPIGTLVTVEN